MLNKSLLAIRYHLKIAISLALKIIEKQNKWILSGVAILLQP